MIREDEEWTDAQAWGWPCHPNIYLRSTSIKAWGCPRHPLLHQQKYQVFFQNIIFLFLHMICVILGASFYFAFSFVLFILLQCMVGSQHICLERFTLLFHCLEHSSFHTYCSLSVQFLLLLFLALVSLAYSFQSLLVCLIYI